MKSEPSTKASTKRFRIRSGCGGDAAGDNFTKPNVYAGFVIWRARR